MTPAELFVGKPLPYALFTRVAQVVEALGPASLRATKGQSARWGRPSSEPVEYSGIRGVREEAPQGFRFLMR